MMLQRLFLLSVICAACLVHTRAEPINEDIYSTCGDSLVCAEQKLVNIVDQYDTNEKIPIVGDVVVLEKTQDVPATRGKEGLVDRLERFLRSHELKLKLPLEEETKDDRSDRAVFTERSRRRRLRRLILPILLLLKLKAAVVIPAVLTAISLVAFKGLAAGLIALGLSAVTAIKSIVSAGHHGHSSKVVQYEVVPGWGRTSGAGAGAYPAYPEAWPYEAY